MTERQIITRAEAKALGLKRYFTGKPCKHEHVAERQVSNGKCVECHAEYDNSPERKAEKATYHASTEGKAKKAAYFASPASKTKKAEYNVSPEGKASNRKRCAKRRAFKRACEILRTAEEDARIKAMHFQATRLTIETGVVHHVDHKTPLARGGADRHDNLQVVPWFYNVAKGDLTEDEMCDAILTGERPLRKERKRIEADDNGQ